MINYQQTRREILKKLEASGVQKLPWRPEYLEALRARIPAALEKLWVPPYEGMGFAGCDRRYVFDLVDDTLRIIVTRELQPAFGPGPFIHSSVGLPSQDVSGRPQLPIKQFVPLAIRRAQELLTTQLDPAPVHVFHQLSSKCLHLWFDL